MQAKFEDEKEIIHKTQRYDVQFTLNSSWPRFSECFQSTVLTTFPASFLFVASVFYVPYLLTRDVSGSTATTTLIFAKTSVSLALTFGTIGHIIKETKYPVNSVSPNALQTDMIITDNIAYLTARITSIISYVSD
ncbi:multidrug resistance-associated protein 1 [Elysia marginata]|uniref:Multidrug resistance-associated protein 1 n=1 Tax=Elysia marginata TaxID=1093978 RepID=A0AAV4F1M4_9GAST|nr:multidrug resistance-associated protein 1 [Elysia marginata]